MKTLKDFKIVAIGDIAAAGATYEEILNAGGNPLAALKELIGENDISIASVESPMTTMKPVFENKCCLKSNKNLARALREIGVKVVSLANNHVMDCGIEGLFDTLESLTANGIRWVGAGMDINEAMSALIMEAGGEKIAFLAATGVPVASKPYYASIDSPGLAPLDLDGISEQVRILKSQGHIVVLSVHWGMELYHYPIYNQVKMAHYFVNQGVDFLIGNHAHVVQPVEIFKGSVIAYCQGNVLFPNPFGWAIKGQRGQVIERRDFLSDEKRYSLVLTVGFEGGQQRVEYFGTFIGEDQQVKLKDARDILPTWGRMKRYPWRFIGPVYSFYMEIGLRILPFFEGKNDWRNFWTKINFANFKAFCRMIIRSISVALGWRNSFYD